MYHRAKFHADRCYYRRRAVTEQIHSTTADLFIAHNSVAFVNKEYKADLLSDKSLAFADNYLKFIIN